MILYIPKAVFDSSDILTLLRGRNSYNRHCLRDLWYEFLPLKSVRISLLIPCRTTIDSSYGLWGGGGGVGGLWLHWLYVRTVRKPCLLLLLVWTKGMKTGSKVPKKRGEGGERKLYVKRSPQPWTVLFLMIKQWQKSMSNAIWYRRGGGGRGWGMMHEHI
jgi:hypothetical protein